MTAQTLTQTPTTSPASPCAPRSPLTPTPNPPTVAIAFAAGERGPCAGRDDRSKEVGRGGPKTHSAKGGPRTPEGKAASSRNATSHGLFAKHAVLPHLGEDPAEYESLLRHLFDQVRPRNLLERQYLELWAEASWKLRRLSRLEADVWEADALTTAERLAQLERLDRLQSSLRRKMDKAIHMLGPDLPRLFATRTREDLMDHLGLTPSLCADHPYRERDLEDAVRAHRTYPDPSLTDPLLSDAIPTGGPDLAEATRNAENCENEPSAPAEPLPHSFTHCDRHPSPSGEGKGEPQASRGRGQTSGADLTETTPENKKRENELPAPHSESSHSGRSLYA